jgi:hypothetical protein
MDSCDFLNTKAATKEMEKAGEKSKYSENVERKLSDPYL